MSANIILYSTGCPKCKVLKMKLDKAGIDYTEENDKEKMISMGMKSTPMLSVDGRMLSFSDACSWIGGGKEHGD